ncbi:hypothetical protein DMN91_005668 [Ooceraea biroi]|uniref:Odorant receptor n=1 Tax=Ooceraea biroi TaxID=2015173 RepID=A0A3L8DLI7_OOCBI|nr:uncharacterized protein LOC105285164 isoform X2 [Ooceraea biroi]RLU21295.1 hypothetical protein DMN91_005668 [Ooceraea biroi]
MTICVVDQHFSLNKMLLRAVALWPYRRTKLIDFHVFLILVIFISFILVQLTTFLTTECTPEMIIKSLCYTSDASMYVLTYTSFWLNVDTIRCLLEKFQYICDELTDEGEIAIIKQYGNGAKRFTIMFSLCIVSNISITCLLPVFPRILRTFTSINVSEEHFTVHVMREYFIDQEKYYYCILLHFDVTIFIGGIGCMATGTLLFGCIKYICGIFRIASYRIDQAMQTATLHHAVLSNNFILYKKIVRAIDIHRKAVKLCDIITSNFVGTFFIMMIVCIISLSLNLYGLHRALMLRSTTEEYVAYVSLTATPLVYIFSVNYAGQKITDHHNYIFINVYNCKWYRTPLYIQRIILFLLRRGTNNNYLVFGGLAVLSLERAATMISTSISYFTVLYSTQQSP